MRGRDRLKKDVRIDDYTCHATTSVYCEHDSRKKALKIKIKIGRK